MKTIGMMKTIRKNKLTMLQFPRLSGYCNIAHFITTRAGGVSEGAYASMNPATYSGDNPERVRKNRQLLADVLGISSDCFLAPYQIHEERIALVEDSFLHWEQERRQAFLQGADAVITPLRGLCPVISTADCVPVLLYAPDVRVVAAVHAGWRGTVRQIVRQTVETLVSVYQADPRRIEAGIGPFIGKEAFEVGEEVVEAFRASGADLSAIAFRHPANGKAHIDLGEANRLQLLAGGLLSERIEKAGICTYTDPEHFFSARRLGIHSGRIWSGILIKDT